jgi:hypothetical protein
MSLAWAFVVGAGDGNRTRAVSLGIKPIPAVTAPDLASARTASDRECPLITAANCTLIARRRRCWLRVLSLLGTGTAPGHPRASGPGAQGRPRPEHRKPRGSDRPQPRNNLNHAVAIVGLRCGPARCERPGNSASALTCQVLTHGQGKIRKVARRASQTRPSRPRENYSRFREDRQIAGSLVE